MINDNNKYDDYTAPSGELIQKYKDGSDWIVSSSNNDEVRWSKQFRFETDANAEFERWRK